MNYKATFTGERMDNHPDSDLYISSFERYKFAFKFIHNDVVLDIACGTGYGSNLLADKAREVIAVDIDEDLINYCKKKYERNNLKFMSIKPDDRTIKELKRKFDVVVCLETIEHVKNFKKFLSNLALYTKTKGKIIISTPNNFRQIHPPKNKYHQKEWDILDLYNILKKTLSKSKVELYGQLKTNYRRSDYPYNPKSQLRNFVAIACNILWNLDFKYTKFLHKLERFSWYKKLSNMQRGYNKDTAVYKIDPKSDFFNPEISLFIIQF